MLSRHVILHLQGQADVLDVVQNIGSEPRRLSVCLLAHETGSEI